MPKRYCPNCGFGTDYSFQKPTSCARCKKGFESVFATTVVTPTLQQQTPIKSKKTEIPDEDEEAPEFDIDFASIRDIGVSIEMETPKALTFDNIVKDNLGGVRRKSVLEEDRNARKLLE